MHDHGAGSDDSDDSQGRYDGAIIDLTLSDDEDDDDGAQGHSAYVRLTRSDRYAGYHNDNEENNEEGAFFFGGIMRSRACAVCRTQTFMFGPDRRPTCNTCFGRTHGAVVLPSRTHGYGVFALHAARGAIDTIDTNVTWICDAVPLGSSSPSSPSSPLSPLTTTATATTVPVFPEPHITEAFATRVEAFETRVETVATAETVEAVEAAEALGSARSARPVFTEGQTVMYMGGELFSEKEHGALFGECGTPFAVSAGDGQVLDATLYRNPACYINSVLPDFSSAFGSSGFGSPTSSPTSPNGCGASGSPTSSQTSSQTSLTIPNMKMWYETDTGNVSITALRDIYDGEELFLDYGPGYAWDIGCTVSVTRDRDRGTKRAERAERAERPGRPERPERPDGHERPDWEDWTGGPEWADIADRPIVKRARTASGETRIIVALE
jgi:hypothetical protein